MRTIPIILLSALVLGACGHTEEHEAVPTAVELAPVREVAGGGGLGEGGVGVEHLVQTRGLLLEPGLRHA